MDELYNYIIKVKITDKQMKPQHLQGERTNERVFWIDEVEANKFPDEETAKLAIMLQYKGVYSPKQYTLEIVSIRESLIIPQSNLILPEE